MKRLNRIGVGIDFRDKTDHVLASAARLARSSGAELDLIHVLRPPPVYDRVLVRVRDLPDTEKALANARHSLELLAASPVARGVVSATHVWLGIPEVEILERAAELGDDLLLVGPSTRRRAGWFGVGRTASRLVQRAHMPILVAKGDLAEKPARIVAATDFSEASRPALVEAVELAKLWNAELVLLHVLEPLFHLHGLTAKIAGESEVYAVEPSDLEPEWQSLAAHLDLEGLRHRHEVVKGEPVEAILTAVENAAADLLVVGTHGRSAVTRALLGSSAEAILEEYPGPVLIVPADAEVFSH
jgi:nucleotide-binding universal stress UspA family protein